MQGGEDWEFVAPMGSYLPAIMPHKRSSDLWMGGHLYHGWYLFKREMTTNIINQIMN